MSKPPIRRIPSDDCAVTIDGVTYRPHEGEWVDIVGTTTVGDMMATAKLEQFGTKMAAIEGDPDEGIQMLRLLDGYFGQVCAGLARRIVDWNWTDDAGVELPKPFGNPEAFHELRPSELTYLIAISKGERSADRKNASRPSPITSSATASAPTRAANSITGRNRRRAS